MGHRYRRFGELGLLDRLSPPHSSPAATPPEVIAQIEAWRREHKRSAQRITKGLAAAGHGINRRTSPRHLTRLGLGLANPAPQWAK